MIITKIIERDMWHRLPNHASKCRNLHWHRYQAHISLKWDIAPANWSSNEGMVVDFSDIKKIAKWYIDDNLDHGYMYIKSDPIWELATDMSMKTIAVDFVPTSENIAKFLFEKLNLLFTEKYWDSIILHQILLYETPSSSVVYPGE
jgi:6-pyruvoyltetrahydropterin/6-carboxytetrahydropterin synthase